MSIVTTESPLAQTWGFDSPMPAARVFDAVKVYGIGDAAIGIATVPLPELLAALGG